MPSAAPFETNVLPIQDLTLENLNPGAAAVTNLLVENHEDAPLFSTDQPTNQSLLSDPNLETTALDVQLILPEEGASGSNDNLNDDFVKSGGNALAGYDEQEQEKIKAVEASTTQHNDLERGLEEIEAGLMAAVIGRLRQQGFAADADERAAIFGLGVLGTPGGVNGELAVRAKQLIAEIINSYQSRALKLNRQDTPLLPNPPKISAANV